MTFVDRAGLNISELTDEQQAAALKVLEALLSDEGYETVTGIMGGTEFLHENSNSTEESLGQYYIAFFGDPSDSGTWEPQFGSHHLGINATLDGSADCIAFAATQAEDRGTTIRNHLRDRIRVLRQLDRRAASSALSGRERIHQGVCSEKYL